MVKVAAVDDMGVAGGSVDDDADAFEGAGRWRHRARMSAEKQEEAPVMREPAVRRGGFWEDI